MIQNADLSLPVFMSQDTKVSKKNVQQELGSSTIISFRGFSGNNDYNNKLTGTSRIREYDQMRLSDSTVRACVLLIKLPIIRANWFFTSDAKDSKSKEIRKFVEDNLFNGMTITWAEWLMDALNYLIYGNAVYELVYRFDEDGKIRLKRFGRRPSDTIIQWELKDGDNGVVQRVGNKDVEIPIEKLLILVNEKEGSNWEGLSIFRSAYRNFDIKDKMLKIDAIAAERQGLGIPKATVPMNYSAQKRRDLEILLENMRVNEKAYSIAEDGVVIEWMDMKASSTREVLPSINYHDRQIAKSVLADFMELGATTTGSYALSEDKTEMFLLSLEAVASYLADSINEYVVKRLVDLNYNNVKAYPKLQFAGIKKADLDKISTSLERLTKSGILTVDDTLEDHVRDQFNLPEKDPMGEGEDSDLEAHDHGGGGHRSFKNRVIQSIREEALTEIKQMKDAVDQLLDGDERTPITQYKL